MSDVKKTGLRVRGDDIHLITLGNDNGVTVRLIDLGGTLTELYVPDEAGRTANVLLGFGDLADYARPGPYFGNLIGRFANRISGGRFALDGKNYTVPPNEGRNASHGGPDGFSFRRWAILEADRTSLRLGLVSPDGDSGFPGKLSVEVTYSLGADNSLRVDYFAVTELEASVVNLTVHPYFNLAGEASGSALNHVLTLAASRYLPTDAELIPLGNLEDVAGTPFDLRTPTEIASRINNPHPQLVLAGGFDHCFVLDEPGIGKASLHLCDPASGRVLEIETSEPGLQFYSGNELSGSLTGTSGRPYRFGDGLAFETQHFPDSPNRPAFPSTRLAPGEEFHSTTIFRFGAQ